MTDDSAREKFGLMIKNLRSGQGKDRGCFAEQVGISVNTLINMEHGVKNPTRRECVRVIRSLRLPKRQQDELYALLRVFSPFNRPRIKHHIDAMILIRRRGVYRSAWRR